MTKEKLMLINSRAVKFPTLEAAMRWVRQTGYIVIIVRGVDGLVWACYPHDGRELVMYGCPCLWCPC